MALKSQPYFSAFLSRKVLNCLQPKSDKYLDNLRFLTIPDTFKSSQTITWFSLIILVDTLEGRGFRPNFWVNVARKPLLSVNLLFIVLEIVKINIYYPLRAPYVP